MRLDKFLKVSRLIKRRTIANEACDAGRVLVNGKVAKASLNVKEGDIIGICDKKLVAKGSDVQQTTLDTIEKLAKGKDMLSVYFGQDVTQEEADLLMQKVADKFDWLETACYRGGQPHYYYILSAE